MNLQKALHSAPARRLLGEFRKNRFAVALKLLDQELIGRQRLNVPWIQRLRLELLYVEADYGLGPGALMSSVIEAMSGS
jgi:hypothetical protein